MVTQPESSDLESTNLEEQAANYAGNLKRMNAGAVLWISKELRHVYYQSTEGQNWDLHCQTLSVKSAFLRWVWIQFLSKVRRCFPCYLLHYQQSVQLYVLL